MYKYNSFLLTEVDTLLLYTTNISKSAQPILMQQRYLLIIIIP